MADSLLIGRLRWVARRVANSSLVQPRTQEDRNTRMLFLNTASIGVASGGIAAFISVFLARLGASPSLMGWLSSAPALLSVVSLIPGAMLAERNPDQVQVRVRYARMMRFTYFLCGIAPFVVPISYLPVVLVVIWTLQTFPNAVAVPAWTSVLAQAVPPRRRAQLNGVRWALLSVVSALSSAFFGWLLDRISFPLNYQIVFLISYATSWLDPFFFSRIVVPPLPIPTLRHAPTLFGRFAEYLRPVRHHKPFLRFLSLTLLYRVALSLPAPLFSLFWVNELQAPNTLIGLRGTVGHAALVIGFIYWGRSANRWGHRKVLLLSALGLAGYPLLTGLSPSPLWLLPAAAIWGLTASGVEIGLFDLMLASCPGERQPLFAAVWSMAANAALFVGPLLGATLSDATSLSTALILASVAQILATIPLRALPGDV